MLTVNDILWVIEMRSHVDYYDRRVYGGTNAVYSDFPFHTSLGTLFMNLDLLTCPIEGAVTYWLDRFTTLPNG